MLRESAEKVQQELEVRLSTFQEEKANYIARIEELEAELTKAKGAHESYVREVQSKLDEVGPVLQERASLVERATNLEERYKSMMGELEVHSKAAQTAQANYKHELLTHAQDVRLVEELQEKLITSQAELEKGRTALDNTKSSFDAKEASWREQLSLLQQQNSDLESKVADLKQQNEVCCKRNRMRLAVCRDVGTRRTSMYITHFCQYLCYFILISNRCSTPMPRSWHLKHNIFRRNT